MLLWRRGLATATSWRRGRLSRRAQSPATQLVESWSRPDAKADTKRLRDATLASLPSLRAREITALLRVGASPLSPAPEAEPPNPAPAPWSRGAHLPRLAAPLGMTEEVVTVARAAAQGGEAPVAEL